MTDKSTAPQPPQSAAHVSRDALLYLPGRAIPALVQILTITVLTHYFSKEEIGHYDLAFRFALFLATLSVLWLSMSMLRFHPAAAASGNLPVFHRALAALKWGMLTLGGVVGALCYFLGPDTIFGGYRSLIPPSLLVFVSYSLYEIGCASMRAQGKPIAYSVASSANALARLPLAVALFAWWGMGIEGMLWSLGITYLASYLFILAPAMGRGGFGWGAPERALAREILLYGAPVCAIQVLNFCLSNIDRYILLHARGEAEVGLYAVATNLIDQPLTLLFQTFTLAVFPAVATAWESGGRSAAEKLIGETTRIFLLLCLPIGVLLSVLAAPIFALLARGDSAEAHTAAPWVAAASVTYGLTYFASFALHLPKKTRVLLGITILALAINIALNLFLAPRLGIAGAALSRGLASVALILGCIWLGHRHLTWQFPWASFLRIALASATAGALVYFLGGEGGTSFASATLLGLLYAAICGVGLFGTGELSWAQLRRFSRR